MPNTKYLNYPEIGDVLFEKSKKAKRVIISVKSPTSIRVAIPKYISFKKAELFVSTKLDWINTQQNKFNNKINVLTPGKSLRTEEKSLILKRVEQLANQYDFTYRKVTLRNMKTRWGSCSTQNNISLNTGLIALPINLRDYIILHELVHTKIKNHSPKFWYELGLVIDNPKQLSKILKQRFGLYVE